MGSAPVSPSTSPLSATRQLRGSDSRLVLIKREERRWSGDAANCIKPTERGGGTLETAKLEAVWSAKQPGKSQLSKATRKRG